MKAVLFLKKPCGHILRTQCGRRTFTMASLDAKGWRFAPLNPQMGSVSQEKPLLQGIVFDVDGTLCEPQNYMFQEMRDVLNISKSTDILDHIHSLPAEEQEEAQEKVRQVERRAMKNQTPQPGLTELMDYIESRGVRKAICTRNFDEPINHLLSTFLPGQTFSPIITRTFKPPKPDPSGILNIAEQWGINPEKRAVDLIMVGDSKDDMTAGAKAGALTVLLSNKFNEDQRNHENTTICIQRLDDLIGILESGSLPT